MENPTREGRVLNVAGFLDYMNESRQPLAVRLRACDSIVFNFDKNRLQIRGEDWVVASLGRPINSEQMDEAVRQFWGEAAVWAIKQS